MLLNIIVVILVMVVLGIEIHLNKLDSVEKENLRQQLEQVHASETARPKFEIILNGVLIENDKQVVNIQSQEGAYPLELRIRNTGSASAQDVQAFLWVPEEVELTSHGNGWTPNGVPNKPSNPTVKVQGVKEYVFLSPATINVNNWMTSRPGILRIPNGVQIVPMRLKLYSAEGVFSEWKFAVSPAGWAE